jgi:nifR3 family TIM-barrel protein
MLNVPLTIGSMTLSNRVMLAPMAGVTAWPARELCRRMGCAYAVTEMVSVKSVLYSPDLPALLALLDRGDESGPLGLQLFGAEPADYAEAITTLHRLGRLSRYDAIDINMGCPAPKVWRSGAGSALLAEPERAAAIVASCVNALRAIGSDASSMPVTVKTRLGESIRDGSAVRLARMVQDEGAAAITVHGRTRDQQYSGKADLEGIAQVKAAVSIPVIGNGDIASADDALSMMRQTGCDGIMIGRAAIGFPWTFRRVLDASVNAYSSTGLTTGLSAEPALTERLDMALTHASMHCAWRGEQRGMIELRGQLSLYMKGMPGAGRWRVNAHNLCDIDSLRELIRSARDACM